MKTLFLTVLVFTLFSLSQFLLSKGAEARQNARGSLLDQYTYQNESFEGRMNPFSTTSSREEEVPLSGKEQIQALFDNSDFETHELDSLEVSEHQELSEYQQNEHFEAIESPSLDSLEDVELDQVSTTFLNKLNGESSESQEAEEVHEHYVQDPMFNVEDITVSDIVTFPEVDITFSESPDSGHFFIAGEIKEKYDDVLVLADDGTKERVFEHFKFRDFEEKDVFIGQVIVEGKRWHLSKVWVPVKQGEEEEAWKEVS